MPAHGALPTVPIVVVSEHEMIGWAIGYSLRSEGLDARFQRSRSAGGVLDSLGRVRAGIALLDLDLERDDPGDRVDGVELVAPLNAAGWRILALTGSADAGRLGAALAAGAFAWVPKNAPFPTLLVAIREALSGRSTTSPSRRRELIELHLRRERDHHRIAARLATLSAREREVLVLLAAGQRATTIAAGSRVSPATVRTQVAAVLTKLEVRSQLEAVALYLQVRQDPGPSSGRDALR